MIKKGVKDKVLEFRLLLDHEAFLRSDDLGRQNLIIDVLWRSVEEMEKLGVPARDRAKLKEVLTEARLALES